MHAVFFLYGMKHKVDRAVKWLETRALPMKFENLKNGEIENHIIECQLRPGPFGVWEFIFPEEHKDAVLTALNFKNNIPYGKTYPMQKLRLASLRTMLGLKKAPKFDDSKTMPLPHDLFGEGVSLIPIGVRYDEFKDFPDGYFHEAI